MATMKQVRRVAWSIFWRVALSSVVAGFLVGAVFGFIVGFLGAMLHLPQQETLLFIQLGSAILGLAASFLTFNFFLARAIGKRIGNRQLELVDAAFGEKL